MSADTLGAELNRLADLDRDELMERWCLLYDKEPPTRISRSLLLHAIAYRMQEKALGGLKPATRRFLAQFTAEQMAMPAVSIRTGTRLLREWHGVTYEVTVLDDGVMFQGKQYRSLSEVARAITGTKWSGPLFFGLRKKAHG
jgi:hypothetical protein